MMENQHRKIKGYRDLTEVEVASMNQGKELEAQVMEFIDVMGRGRADPRWLAIAKTDIQKGFMALGRAIARPHS